MSKPTRNRTRKAAAKPLETPPPHPEPNAEEKSAIAASKSRLEGRSPRLVVQFGSGSKANEISPNHSDHAGWIARLQDAFGTRGTAFASCELNRLVTASTLADGTVDQTRINGLIAFIDGMKPKTELEAMVACQLAVTHGLSMELLQRTKDAKQLVQFEAAGNMAAKMLRAFAMQVDALVKLQRGGEQSVRVEHIHVHSGGNAMVGTVVTGGRATEKSEHQPHAPQQNNQTGAPRSLTYAPGQTLPSFDPKGGAVPVASGERQGALPDARRREG